MNPYQPGEDNQDPYEVGYKAGAASRDAEVAELKSVPMKYRRMAFNAKLQDEISELRKFVQEQDELLQECRPIIKTAENVRKERDQLREHVKMLRDALQITHELYTQASSGYGFAHPENPHNFHCDIDCCSKEEIAAHSKACDDYAAGRKVSNDSWGIGTYCDEYAPAIEALAATEPKE